MPMVSPTAAVPGNRRSVLLLGLVGLFAVLLVGLWGVSTAIDRQHSLDQAGAELAGRISLVTRHAGTLLNGTDLLLSQLAAQVREQGGLPAYRTDATAWRQMTLAVQAMPIVQFLALIDRQGKLVDSSRPTEAGRLLADQPFFRARRSGPDGLMAEIADGIPPLALLSRPLADAKGGFDGVVVEYLDIAGLADLLNDPNSALWLLTTDGRVLATAQGNDPAAHLPTPLGISAADWSRPVLQAAGRPVIVSLADGRLLAAARPLEKVPLVAMICRSEWQALTAWRERTRHSFIALLLGVTICLGLGLLAKRSAVREACALDSLHRTNLRLTQALAAQEQATAAACAADAAKSRFLDAASHDLRQPIQAVGLYLDTLQQIVRSDFDRRVVQWAQTALAGTNSLLDALAEVGRLDAGLPELHVAPLPLGPLLEDLVAHHHSQAITKGIRLQLVATSARIVSDPVLLRRILDNLLDNALRFTSQGRVLVGCRRLGPCLRIEIWDTGVGIPPDQLQAVFEDFYQIGNSARHRAEGIGLGLAVVRRAAGRLGHPIGLRSVPGRGSVFFLTVPRPTGPHPESRPQNGSPLLIQAAE